MIVFVKIDPTTGNGLGPNFTVSSNFGSVSPGVVTRTELLDGFYFVVDDLATKIKLTSQGNCTNSFEVNIANLPPTTTTTSTTTLSCSIVGGGTAVYVADPSATTSTTSTTTIVLPTTTTTTTQAPIAVIQIAPYNADGSIVMEVFRQSGTNPNTLVFTGTAVQYSNTNCTTSAGTHSFSVTLNANTAFNTVVIPTANPAFPKMKIITLTVNGTLTINSSPKSINVGGNTYQIVGYNQCVST